MIVNYSPNYTVLENCPKEYIEYLIKYLEHNISEETLKLFNDNIISKLPITKHYLFRTTLNKNGTYNIELYSGLLTKVLREVYIGNTCIDPKNLIINSSVKKYSPSNKIISTVLRAHQIKIVEACLKHRRGIIKAPTSSGKSFVIAELVRIFKEDNLRILISVPTISLLHQMERDINNYMSLNNLDEIEIGKVGDGNYEFKDIAIGIPNSLCKLNKTKEYLETIEVLLIDECHMTCNPTFAAVIEASINRRVTLGLSATPDVYEDLNYILEGFIGPRIISITEQEMINTNIILEPQFNFYPSPKSFLPSKLNEQALKVSSISDHHRYKLLPIVYDHLIINNVGRNNLIITKTLEQINRKNGPIIIIVNKISGPGNHGEVLQNLLFSKGYNFPLISGYISKKKRESIIEDLNNNSIVGVIAGPKVLSTGISIPSLSSIILCGAGKSNTEFIQRVGRLLRKKEGKEQPIVIDFIDQQYWFANQSKSRLQIAKSIYGEKNVKVF